MIAKKLFNFDNFDEKISRTMSDWKVPGCAVAIIKDGEVLHWKGFGFRDIEKQLPVEIDTVFAIGSTSKAFTSVSVAILVDRGLLDWDTPVKHYIPEFDLVDKFAAERMTVRDLMSHRSGLPRHDALWYGTSFSRKEVFERLKFLQPSEDFRTTFQYQNLMFMAAGYLVERVTDQSWEEFTRENILEPLGMDHTTLCVDGIKNAGNAAIPYSAREVGYQQLAYRDLDVISPAGGINSCLTDLAKWISFHLQEGSYENSAIISSEKLAVTHTAVTNIENTNGRLLKPFKEIGKEQYGLGWFMHDYRGRPLLRHGGHIDGFSTQISFMPEIGAGVIVLSNVGGSDFMFVPTFMAYDVLLEMSELDWSKRLLNEEEKIQQSNEEVINWFVSKEQRKTAPSHPLAAYEGVYYSKAYGKITIDLQDGKLKANFNSRVIHLTHYHFDIFNWNLDRPGSIPLKANFMTDELGFICGFNLQLEPMVSPIFFEKLAEPELSKKSMLAGYAGIYLWDETPIHVILHGESDLRIISPFFPEMHLAAYQPGLYKVTDHAGWYVEFHNNPVTGLSIIQPATIISAQKNNI